MYLGSVFVLFKKNIILFYVGIIRMAYGFPVRCRLPFLVVRSSETYCGFVHFFCSFLFYGFVVSAGCKNKNTSLSAPFLGQAKKIIYLQLFENCCLFFFSQQRTRRGGQEKHTNTNDKNGGNWHRGRAKSLLFSFRTLRTTVMLPMGITTLCLAGEDLEQLMATRNPARKPPWDA